MTFPRFMDYFKITAQTCSALSLAGAFVPATAQAQSPPLTVRNTSGIVMSVDPSHNDPVLSVTVPDRPPTDSSFKILLPEHVTVREHGQMDAQHLYIYGRNPGSVAVHWLKIGNAIQYETNFGQIHFLARATLVGDGILFHYEFTNNGETDYDMATAVTDPRFHAVFYDPRLERTYVHQADGFALLAASAPERLTLPIKEWFPVRYHASYTAPIPADLVQKRTDGITYRYSSVRVDTPSVHRVLEQTTETHVRPKVALSVSTPVPASFAAPAFLIDRRGCARLWRDRWRRGGGR